MTETHTEKQTARAARQLDMLHGSLWDTLTIFALPLALTGVLQQLFNAADVAVLGQFVGKEAMAAVGNNTPVISLFVTLFLGLSLGSNVVIARYLGAREPEKAHDVLHTAIPLALIMGIILMTIGELAAVPLLTILGVPSEVMAPAETYLRIYLAGLPVISLYNFEAAIVRSRGDTRTPLMALAVASGLNLVLDLAFTIFLDGGVAGVAIATVLANVTSSGILFRFLRHNTGVLHLDLRDLHIRRQYLATIVRIGLPAGIQGMVFSISNVVVQSAINSLGADAMAASAAAFVIEVNVYCFINAYGQAATTFVSQNYGARNYARCRRVFWVCLGLCLSVTTFLVLLVYWQADGILGFFSTNPEVIRMAHIRLQCVTYLQCINIVIEMISDSMRGYGLSLPPALLALFGICGFRLLWIWTVFPAYPTFTTIMAGYPISWFITAVLLVMLYAWFMKHQKQRGMY